jgi:DNA-directed RNA polymerase alpha subunit
MENSQRAETREHFQERQDEIASDIGLSNPTIIINQLRNANAQWERRYTTLLETQQHILSLEDKVERIGDKVSKAVVQHISDIIMTVAGRLGLQKTVDPDALEAKKDVPIDNLLLSFRSLNALKNEGIKTVGQLCGKSKADLLRIYNFGTVSLNEVNEELAQHGLSLRERKS